MYLVQQGSVAVYKNEPNPSDPDHPHMKVISVKRRGDVLGELAVIFRQPRTAGAIAENVVVCNVLQKTAFESVIVDFHKDRETIQLNLEREDLHKASKIFWDSKYVCFRKRDDLHSNLVHSTPAGVQDTTNDSELEHLRYDLLAFKDSMRESLSEIKASIQALSPPKGGAKAGTEAMEPS